VPDPRHGVFETLLVLDGRPVELDAHLARLEASLAELFPERGAPDLRELDVPVDRGAMRIDVTPESTTVAFRELEPHSGEIALHSLTLAGGLGAHKWADRSLLDEAQAGLSGEALPLIVDSDGAALEASRANVFAVRDGALFTPPLDGRILPGITRMRVLEIAAEIGIEAGETSLSRDDLLAADEVFLTGSVRGVERAARLDSAALGGGGEVSGRFATALRRAWSGTATTAQPFG
jgi:para-aminobenzoate synthetase/4-amino-4-deoxychorismate lyase